ncbi:class I SAM-dependent methyltransferase [Desulfopila aestuarii]|uniref:Methyltransferase domain-containing protein n=1 Tax=Desulfopila aestuarii DSM 18488 TaxID=1121416 RepID=A0A1M7YLQ5_9BACT|nr:class I SAM-dependent methyltransferase [Desulfopila aestuarii]SHO53519.1 Methyltransferase domain-containing protein [Desulfopila aestuarii DSM 18488]
MKLNDYITSASRPLVYTPGTATMWDDEHISKQLLAVHLNPDIDLASRKPTTILSTIEWLEATVLRPGAAILDMGCGPGLYAEHLAARGYRVSGVDISTNSIHYARESANRKGFDITYHNLDYVELDERETFDLVLMIFTDFGVLVPEIRQKVLSNIYRSLKPGGIFCFDFLNDNFPLAETGNREWEICKEGFWKSGPYLALQEKHYYPKQNVCLSQHIITDDRGEADIYRFWTHAFTHAQIEKLVRDKGFGHCSFYKNILPDCELYRSDDISFCLTTK